MFGSTKNGTIIIEKDDLLKAILNLPNRAKVNNETKSDTHEVTFENGEAVLFDWDEKCNGWRLRNRIVFPVNDGKHSIFCNTCNKVTTHIVNKIVTKYKCLTCNTIKDV